MSEELISKAKVVCEAAIKAADPFSAVRREVHLQDDSVIFGVNPTTAFPLRQAKKIYSVAVGKASGRMMDALQGTLLTQGICVAKHSKNPTGEYPSNLQYLFSSHPHPCPKSVQAGAVLRKTAQSLGEDDLLIALISGGASSLVFDPPGNLPIQDIAAAGRMLMNAGANITELNAVRSQLCLLKGGGLARLAYPAAVIALIISDVPGDDLRVIGSGLTVPGGTGPKEALAVLKKYDLTSRVSQGVLACLTGQTKQKALKEETSLRAEEYSPINRIICSNSRSLSAMKEAAARSGMEARIVDSSLTGEAKTVGEDLAKNARELQKRLLRGDFLCLLYGGETTVNVGGKGIGGRNQELALSASIALDGTSGICLAALATDGEDGSSENAGAIVSGNTVKDARQRGLEAMEFLADNDSGTFFNSAGGYIRTGPTGTNVADVTAVLLQGT